MKTFKEFIHKYDIYASNDNYAIKLTNIIFMFIIFILLAICLFIFHPKEVKAETIPQPNHYSVYKPNGNVNTYSIRLMPQWWWGYNQYVGAGSDAALIITPEVKQEFVWSNFRQYCSDTLIINGSITSVNFSANNDKFDIYINNGSKSNICSKNIDVSSHLVNFSCPITMSSINSVSVSINSTVPVVQFVGGFGLLTNSTYSCTINSSDIINNQNNNTQSIINNNNENANKITSAINDIHKDNEQAEKTRKGILQSIIDLPKTLVNLFVDMLKGLFIPTDEQINDILDKSSDMAQNFGFIGQSVNFFIKLFTSLLSANQGSGCVTLPELTLKFSESSLNMDDWTLWNERDVCFSDHPWIGKTEIIDTIRTVTTLGLLILFLRFAVREFDYILSKENSNSSASKEEGDD